VGGAVFDLLGVGDSAAARRAEPATVLNKQAAAKWKPAISCETNLVLHGTKQETLGTEKG